MLCVCEWGHKQLWGQQKQKPQRTSRALNKFRQQPPATTVLKFKKSPCFPPRELGTRVVVQVSLYRIAVSPRVLFIWKRWQDEGGYLCLLAQTDNIEHRTLKTRTRVQSLRATPSRVARRQESQIVVANTTGSIYFAEIRFLDNLCNR